jgi:hypothetical protein
MIIPAIVHPKRSPERTPRFSPRVGFGASGRRSSSTSTIVPTQLVDKSFVTAAIWPLSCPRADNGEQPYPRCSENRARASALQFLVHALASCRMRKTGREKLTQYSGEPKSMRGSPACASVSAASSRSENGLARINSKAMAYPGQGMSNPYVWEAGDRVIRGGYWRLVSQYCGSAYRLAFEPSSRSDDLGFRVAAVPLGSAPVNRAERQRSLERRSRGDVRSEAEPLAPRAGAEGGAARWSSRFIVCPSRWSSRFIVCPSRWSSRFIVSPARLTRTGTIKRVQHDTLLWPALSD